MDTDDAERPPGDPESPPVPGSGPAIRTDADLADEVLDAMTKAVASLRGQAARMINTAPPVLPAQNPPGET